MDAAACRADPTITEMDPEEVQQNYAPHWGAVTPFGFTQLAGKITDLPPVPKTASLDYAGDFAATKLVGFQNATAEERTATQTETGIFWCAT